MKWRKSPPELIEHFETTVSQFPEATKKKMFGYPCCFCQGNMFTGLHQENWVLRLSEEDREAIAEEYDVSAFEPMKGRKMREYVSLPKEILTNQKLLGEWISKSLEFVKTMPPK